jgi:hypothetical protein
VVAIILLAMVAACGPGSQNPQPQTEQARREEPRHEEPRRDEARGDGSRRDDGENREAGEGRRHKSKSERRREREERGGDERSENGDRNSSAAASAGAASYGNSSAGLSGAPHDLSADEAQGGHTLSKHVGRTDAELQERLQAEPNISAASTWTDRAAAEAAVGSALAANRAKIAEWTGRGARRPNLAIDYRGDPAKPVGRCMRHGSSVAVAASDAVVVLKAARDGDGYYVLTTYPECPR